jgi:diguanylate cyclase (GGDEF)-like protein
MRSGPVPPHERRPPSAPHGVRGAVPDSGDAGAASTDIHTAGAHAATGPAAPARGAPGAPDDPAPSATAGPGLDRRRFRVVVPVVLGTVAGFTALTTSGVLGEEATTVADNLAQFSAGGFATAAGAWSWRRARGADRRWRGLLAIGIGGWTCGLLIWAYYQLVPGVGIPSPSLADVGFFALPAFALPALWAFPARTMPGTRAGLQVDGVGERRPIRDSIFVLDSLVVVGSLFLLTWATALGAALTADRTELAAFLVALGYPITDLVLVVFVVLVGSFRMPANPRALLLLGIGLVSVAVSDSLFLYLVSTGADSMPAVYNIGFVLGPTLLGLSLLAPRPPARRQSGEADLRATERRAVLLPYLPLTVTGLLLVVQLVVGSDLDAVETVLGLTLVAVVVGRQLVTLLDNVNLLHQVRDGQDRLRRQAFNDSLTGLANRALFRDRLTHAIDVHLRDERPLALLFCDLDDFKHVNDQHGHAAGDEVLRTVADRLRACVRAGDTVARLGGDEFALLLESGSEAPELVGRRVLAEMERPVTIGARGRGSGVPVRVGASVGLVVMDPREDGITPDVLLARVDTAMYAAKRHGKSRLVSYGGETVSDADTTALIGQLRGALALAHESDPDRVRELRARAGAVEVMYQPVVHVKTTGVVALEALVRWRHPQLGVVPAEWLVEKASESGLLGALEEHVLDVACGDIHKLRTTPGLGGLAVHVNVSAARTGDARLLGAVQDVLERYDLPGAALVLEITENSRVPDLAGAADVLEEVRRLGVRLALDDFGKGYSGLSYLQDLPVDIVKIDRSVTTADVGTRGAAIRHAIVTLARDLGIDLIAEGVETHGQAMQLTGLGCDFAQGYLYSRPRFLADMRLVPENLADADDSDSLPA